MASQYLSGVTLALATDLLASDASNHFATSRISPAPCMPVDESEQWAARREPMRSTCAWISAGMRDRLHLDLPSIGLPHDHRSFRRSKCQFSDIFPGVDLSVDLGVDVHSAICAP